MTLDTILDGVAKRIDELVALGSERRKEAADQATPALRPWDDAWLEPHEAAELERLRLVYAEATRDERSAAAAKMRVEMKRAERRLSVRDPFTL